MSSSMQVSLETLDGLQRKLTVQLPAERIENAVSQKLQHLGKTAKMDGFRPGKVPFKLVQQRFGGQVRQEVLSDVIETSFRQAVVENKLNPAGVPTIQALPASDDKGFGYAAVFEVYPEIAVQSPASIELETVTAEVAEADVDEMIENLRKQRMQWDEVARTAQMQDQVTIEFVGRVDGEEIPNGRAEGFELVLGSHSMLEGFEDQLIGAQAGDSKLVRVSFPEATPDKTLAGKDAEFDVTVSKVSEPRLPEMDAEFLSSYGVKEGGVDQLRQNVRDNMQRELAQTLKQRAKQQVMDGLLAAYDFAVPSALVKDEVQRLRQQLIQQYAKGTDTSMFGDDALFEPQAQRRVKLGLIIAEIIKQNGFKADADKVRNAVEELAASYDDAAQVVSYYYSRRDLMQNIEALVLEDSVVAWVIAGATNKSRVSNFKDVMQAQSKAEN